MQLGRGWSKVALSSFLLKSAFTQHCPSDIKTDYPTIPEASFQRRGASDLKNWGGRVHGRRFPAPGFDVAPDLDSLSLPGAIEMLISEERRATALGVCFVLATLGFLSQTGSRLEQPVRTGMASAFAWAKSVGRWWQVGSREASGCVGALRSGAEVASNLLRASLGRGHAFHSPLFPAGPGRILGSSLSGRVLEGAIAPLVFAALRVGGKPSDGRPEAPESLEGEEGLVVFVRGRATGCQSCPNTSSRRSKRPTFVSKWAASCESSFALGVLADAVFYFFVSSKKQSRSYSKIPSHSLPYGYSEVVSDSL